MPKILFTCLLASIMSTVAFAKELPSQFKNNQIYLTPKLKDGTSLRIFTDTGGGLNMISKALSDKYEWPIYEKQDGDSSLFLTDMPEFRQEATIPMAGLNNFLEGKLAVIAEAQLPLKGDYDVLLGGRWHAEKIIDFNYPEKTIANLSSMPNTTKFTKIDLGFQKDPDGQYTTAFPSIEIEVAGQVIPMLFDTGASAWPTPQAKKLLGLNGTQVGTSFMAASVFDKWVKEHPEWVVVENACLRSKAPMIKVPEIKIGDRLVGPVWFTKRRDTSFHDYMSTWMDRRVEGALGGSALQHVRVIVDYPNELAYVANDI